MSEAINGSAFAHHYAKCRGCKGQVHAEGPPPEAQDYTLCEPCLNKNFQIQVEPTVAEPRYLGEPTRNSPSRASVRAKLRKDRA